MRISAKADYAVRATIELAAAGPDAVVKGERLADAQDIPGIVATRRGPEGGYKLARPAADVSVADVIRAVEGPLASVRGDSPESLSYEGSAEPLQQVWIALRGNLRAVLETVSLADLVRGELPRSVAELARDPDAWARR